MQKPLCHNANVSFAVTLLSGVIGGVLFMLLRLPVPWLLGPMLAVLIGSNVTKVRFNWPAAVRNTGMMTVGYTIGLAMTATALKEIYSELPSMLMMTSALIALCAGIAAVVARLTGIDYKTVLLGSIPGGLTQMIILAEETKGIDITVVTVIQVIRLMMIIISVPLLVFGPLSGIPGGAPDAAPALASAHADWSGLFPGIILFAAMCVVCAFAGSKVNFPTPYLLGPAIGTAALQIAGLSGPALPSTLLAAAQLMIGVYVGLLLKPANLQHKLRTLLLAVLSSVLLITGAWLLSLLLELSSGASPATALLSTAPGGMDQMGLIAHEVNADLPMVAGYQLFRTFFIFFAIPPLLKLFFRVGSRVQVQAEGQRQAERQAK
ncbi:membrane AbrB-like protein [Paenibacillus forsythiae]|uniref:Membrane AbrB-like protein n=1 Tax=Paenibacillus forsythiae TaxID=365616 RepID=A0ABU3H1P8_9BACL|nr:AbrB family transcriptional regulator [Paenibacillus forsythiae]MDT3424738.1 membrane AbrB-like protein [Paenibacillus forsythiae]